MLFDQIEYYLLDGSIKKGQVHGKPYGNWTTITIRSSEVLFGIKGKTDTQFIGVLTLVVMTQDRQFKYYGPFGSTGSQPFAAYSTRSILGNESPFLNGLTAPTIIDLLHNSYMH